MINPFYEKLARLAVNYSVNVKKGDRVFISGPIIAQELFKAIYVEVIKAGGHPLTLPQMEGNFETLLKYGSEAQITYVDDILLKLYEEFDSAIQIFGDYNTRKLSLIDPVILGKYHSSPKRKKIIEVMTKREAKGEYKWVIVPFPCHSHAQEANMDLFSFTDFVEKALMLDKADPIKEWTEVKEKQEKLINYLNNTDIIKVKGEDTELIFSVKGRTWENCCGLNNLPDGEVYTGPIEDSVNGYIRFTYPGIYNGREVENIYLEFKNGKVINANASKGGDLLEEILKIENADIIGEFAIGTNYGITKFTKNILFDEKIGGTIHCALGFGIPTTGSKNMSAIHWDILKDMKSKDSKIFLDGEEIYKAGKWLIPK